jgi:electron transfer flavoprotein beta subunit
VVQVERVLTDGFETLEAELPAVVTVSNELGTARKPNLRETMRAARKPLSVKTAADFAMPSMLTQTRRVRERLYVPVNDGVCEMIEGADEAAQAAALVKHLHDVRLIAA